MHVPKWTQQPSCGSRLGQACRRCVAAEEQCPECPHVTQFGFLYILGPSLVPRDTRFYRPIKWKCPRCWHAEPRRGEVRHPGGWEGEEHGPLLLSCCGKQHASVARNIYGNTRQRGTLPSMGRVECFSWGPCLVYFSIEQMRYDGPGVRGRGVGAPCRTRETMLLHARRGTGRL